MSTHNICLHGEIRKYQYFWIKKNILPRAVKQERHRVRLYTCPVCSAPLLFAKNTENAVIFSRVCDHICEFFSCQRSFMSTGSELMIRETSSGQDLGRISVSWTGLSVGCMERRE